MNIEKIKNYNQKMLALLSTILVILAGIGLISFLVFIISEIIPNRRTDTSVLLSDDKLDELKKENLHQQVISYDEPYLIDTAKLIYIIPAGVKTLEKPEKSESEAFGFLNVSSGSGSYRKYNSVPVYGVFNNLLIYDCPANKITKICNDRIIGTDMSLEYFKDETVVVFTGTGTDTDKDGKITPSDFQSLFIYSLKDAKLRKKGRPNATVTEFKYIVNTKDILVTFGLDRNNDHIFDSYNEPTFIMKYYYNNDSLISLVDNTLEKELQKIIDKN